MKSSAGVRDGLLRFYEQFCTGDGDSFAEVIADVPGVSVIGSGPDEGHAGREDWIASYKAGIAEAGIKLRGDDPRGYEEGSVGWAVDRPSFVMPNGAELPTRLTGVLHKESDEWKIVHLHFSVGVPDEQAMELASA